MDHSPFLKQAILLLKSLQFPNFHYCIIYDKVIFSQKYLNFWNETGTGSLDIIPVWLSLYIPCHFFDFLAGCSLLLDVKYALQSPQNWITAPLLFSTDVHYRGGSCPFIRSVNKLTQMYTPNLESTWVRKTTISVSDIPPNLSGFTQQKCMSCSPNL